MYTYVAYSVKMRLFQGTYKGELGFFLNSVLMLYGAAAILAVTDGGWVIVPLDLARTFGVTCAHYCSPGLSPAKIKCWLNLTRIWIKNAESSCSSGIL